MTGDTEQSTLDTYRELNRYDGHDADWRSEAVFAPPRRTLANGWRKFHATRDCGSDRVMFVEEPISRNHHSEKYAYNLTCWECGFEIREEEVLFVGGEWFTEYGWRTFGRPIQDLRLPEERVLELGPDPDREALVDALNLTRIEREGKGFIGFSFGNGRVYECDDCGHETPLTYDGRCRMCYDGEWTDRMQADVETLARLVHERNGSFRHRLPQQLSPTTPGGRAGQNEILWRRHDREGTSKLVEVLNRYEDVDDGHLEYRLTDPTHTEYWRYRHEDLEACFWATGLYNREHTKPVEDDRIREVYQRVCEHSFHTVHDGEPPRPVGEQCIHCRMWQDGAGGASPGGDR